MSCKVCTSPRYVPLGRLRTSLAHNSRSGKGQDRSGGSIPSTAQVRVGRITPRPCRLWDHPRSCRRLCRDPRWTEANGQRQERGQPISEFGNAIRAPLDPHGVLICLRLLLASIPQSSQTPMESTLRGRRSSTYSTGTDRTRASVRPSLSQHWPVCCGCSEDWIISDAHPDQLAS